MTEFCLRVLVGLLMLVPISAQQQLELASPFVDDAVLQRGMAVPVWGWAKPGVRVTVRFGEQEQSATSDERGRWSVALQPLAAASVGRKLVVRDSTGQSIARTGVLVGEVWFASGQSNMDWVAGKSNCRALVEQIRRAEKEPLIREYNVDIGSSLFPRSRAACKNGWQGARQASTFSALALSFAWDLHEALGVPIGILRATHGATNVETWTPASGFDQHAELSAIAATIRASDPATAAGTAAYMKYCRSLVEWQTQSAARIERGGRALPRPRLPGIAAQWKGASRMFNKKIAPLIPYAIRGAIWCQGTHNSGDGRIYATKMAALVDGWRKEWGRPNLPFYFTQMQCYGKPDPDIAGFADIREAQRRFFMAAKNVGMVLQHDLNPSRPTGIHYTNKRDPGRRLARWALAHQYGKSIAFTGPTYASHSIEGAVVRVRFTQRGKGGKLMVGSKGMEADAKRGPHGYVEPARATPGEPLRHFRLAGADRVWHAAKAVISGGEVVVTSPQVTEPVGVQYAYSASPIGANLYNEAGLPATPFAYFDGKQLFQEDLPKRTVEPAAAAKPQPYVTLATIFRPGAVLQRDRPLPVWGFARAGSRVTVRFAGQEKTAVAGEFEQWRVTLEPIAAATKGRTLTATSSDGASRTVPDVIVGDVWVLTGSTQVSGQTFRGTLPEAMPLVREFKIRTRARRFREPRKRNMEIGGGRYRSFWKAATAGGRGFDTSVAGYAFARAVRTPGVPVGVITLGADNPPITWISHAGLQNAKGFERERDDLNQLYPNTAAGKAAVGKYIQTIEGYVKSVGAARMLGEELPDELADAAPAFPQPSYNQWARYVENPTLTYNFCISPLTPMAVRGVVWIPGERNVGSDPARYGAALTAWGASLSATFGQERVPFVFAQPAATLVPGVTAPTFAGKVPVVRVDFARWPKDLRAMARDLGARARDL